MLLLAWFGFGICDLGFARGEGRKILYEEYNTSLKSEELEELEELARREGRKSSEE